MANGPEHLRVYVDANVLITGVAQGLYAASHVLLVAANVTPLNLLTTEVGRRESFRNVEEKVPKALPELEEVFEHSITVVPNPGREREEEFFALADEKDAVHLAAAVDNSCKYLTSYNLDDFSPGHPDVEVVEPGDLLVQMREIITPEVFRRSPW